MAKGVIARSPARGPMLSDPSFFVTSFTPWSAVMAPVVASLSWFESLTPKIKDLLTIFWDIKTSTPVAPNHRVSSFAPFVMGLRLWTGYLWRAWPEHPTWTLWLSPRSSIKRVNLFVSSSSDVFAVATCSALGKCSFPNFNGKGTMLIRIRLFARCLVAAKMGALYEGDCLAFNFDGGLAPSSVFSSNRVCGLSIVVALAA